MTSLCRSLLFLYLGLLCGRIGDGQDAFNPSDSAPAGRQTSNLPEWVERGTYTEGTDTWLVVRTKHPFQSPIEADEAIEPAIRNAIQEYFTEATGILSQPLEIPATEINSQLLVPGTRIIRQYDEIYSAELAARYGKDHGTFHRGFAQLRLSESYVAQTIQQIKKQQVRDRLKLAGAGGVGLLALLAIVFGYFRIDHATRGFYSRRLQTICIIAALLVVLLVCWIMLN